MKKPLRNLLAALCVCLAAGIGYNVCKLGPTTAWRYAWLRLGALFLHHGMSEDEVAHLLGRPHVWTGENGVDGNGRHLETAHWLYGRNPRWPFPKKLNLDFDQGFSQDGVLTN